MSYSVFASFSIGRYILIIYRFTESCYCFDYVLYTPSMELINKLIAIHYSLSRSLHRLLAPSHMWGHVTSTANGQQYKIKINKDFLMRLLKRGYHAKCISYVHNMYVQKQHIIRMSKNCIAKICPKTNYSTE